jgi:CO/xanthine dehydrogenase Mo-binding subunit
MNEFALVGRSLPRLEAPAKATGNVQYIADLMVRGMLYAKALRSPLPHARVVGVDISRAKRIPGVKAIITGQDVPRIKSGVCMPDEYLLAWDKVRYIGDEVAAVAAESEEAAEEALGFISVQYEELPGVFDPEEAMKPAAVPIHEEGNVAYHFQYQRGDIERGLKESAHIFESRYRTQTNHQGYIEPWGCLAEVDPMGRVALWGGFQNVYQIREKLAEALGMEENQFRVIQTYLGGGYGGKVAPANAPLAILLAQKAGRPVRLINTREEELRAGRPRPSGIIEQKIGFKKDGTLVARQVRVVADCGAYAGLTPPIARSMAMRAENLYRFSHLQGEGFAVYTNKTPNSACRAFGTSEGHFALETQIDEIAEFLNMDRVDLRMKNLLQTGDVTNHGWRITSCELASCLKQVAARSGFAKKEKKPGRGIGLACGLHHSGDRELYNFDGSSAFIKLDRDGKASLLTAEADIGQGAWSVLAQIGAEELGARLEDFRVSLPDTDISPYGLGAYAARVTVFGGNAVRLAAADAREQLLKVAAELLEAHPDDLQARDSKIFVRGSPDRSVSFAEVCNAAIYRQGGGPILGRGIYDPPSEMPDEETHYGNLAVCYPFSARAAEVEVDEHTGQVKLLSLTTADDIGQVINPAGAQGQIQGGVSQGLGLALMEEMVWDRGNLVNPNLADYRLPSAADLPTFQPQFVKSHEPQGPFGAKSASEISIVAVPAVIANAIYDAVGVRIRELPINAERVLKAIKEKKSQLKT